MVVSCPHCGSTSVERQPGMADKGWRCLKGVLLMVGLVFVLPASLVMSFMNVIVLITLGMAGLAAVFWGLWLFRRIFSGKVANWDWECVSCKRNFSTAPLHE